MACHVPLMGPPGRPPGPPAPKRLELPAHPSGGVAPSSTIQQLPQPECPRPLTSTVSSGSSVVVQASITHSLTHPLTHPTAATGTPPPEDAPPHEGSGGQGEPKPPLGSPHRGPAHRALSSEGPRLCGRPGPRPMKEKSRLGYARSPRWQQGPGPQPGSCRSLPSGASDSLSPAPPNTPPTDHTRCQLLPHNHQCFLRLRQELLPPWDRSGAMGVEGGQEERHPVTPASRPGPRRGVQGTQAKGSWTPDLEFKQQDQLEVEVRTEGTGEAVPATAGHGAVWDRTECPGVWGDAPTCPASPQTAAEGRDTGDTGVGHRLSERWGGSQAPGDGLGPGPSPRSPVQKQLRRLEAGGSQLDPDTKAAQGDTRAGHERHRPEAPPPATCGDPKHVTPAKNLSALAWKAETGIPGCVCRRTHGPHPLQESSGFSPAGPGSSREFRGPQEWFPEPQTPGLPASWLWSPPSPQWPFCVTPTTHTHAVSSREPGPIASQTAGHLLDRMSCFWGLRELSLSSAHIGATLHPATPLPTPFPITAPPPGSFLQHRQGSGEKSQNGGTGVQAGSGEQSLIAPDPQTLRPPGPQAPIPAGPETLRPPDPRPPDPQAPRPPYLQALRPSDPQTPDPQIPRPSGPQAPRPPYLRALRPSDPQTPDPQTVTGTECPQAQRQEGLTTPGATEEQLVQELTV
ncbi:basic proline-rich protein-like [Eubalaena glacialis]|uniref:basic proline-rich protein-like n=1 Tax=Eubalaena glacialis TaxID=27606 RepID=UPI002A59FE51|nr:basic proline-rich protein-like [Eubalaena glacialis]